MEPISVFSPTRRPTRTVRSPSTARVHSSPCPLAEFRWKTELVRQKIQKKQGFSMPCVQKMLEFQGICTLSGKESVDN
jgi:hypothetical protein